MSEKNHDRKLLVIILAVIVLLILMLIILLNFGRAAKEKSVKIVSDTMKSQVSDFSEQICDELNIMTRVGEVFQDTMISNSMQDQKSISTVIGSICENSSAYMVVFCDENGIGYTQSGIKVNLEKDGFLKTNEDDTPYFAYLQKEKIMQAEAFVSVIPVEDKDNNKGYIVMYYSVSRIKKLFTENSEFADSFLLLSVDNGIIITSENIKEQKEIPETLIEFQTIISPEQGEALEQAVSAGTEISFPENSELEKGNTTEVMYYSPIGINDWYLAIGFYYDDFEKRVEDEGENIHALIWSLELLIFSFVILIMFGVSTQQIMYKKKHKTLKKEAELDLLTGLLNKISLENAIRESIRKNGNQTAVFFVLDIDDFKNINDSFGHQTGDALLKHVGCYFKKHFKSKYIAGRTGGDEFIIFLQDVSEGKVHEAAEHVNRHIRRLCYLAEINFKFSMSIGVSIFPKDAKDFEQLYLLADKALYDAKKTGKDQIVINKEQV